MTVVPALGRSLPRRLGNLAPVRRLSRYDREAMVHIGRWRKPWVTKVMQVVTHLGDASSWMVIASMLCLSGRRALRQARLLGAAAGLAGASSQALKRVCARPRPTTSDGVSALCTLPDAFSFPSGHSAAAFAVAVAFAGSDLALGGALGGLACAIAVSRVYLGAHYPLDVAAGATMGIASGLLARTLAPV